MCTNFCFPKSSKVGQKVSDWKTSAHIHWQACLNTHWSLLSEHELLNITYDISLMSQWSIMRFNGEQMETFHLRLRYFVDILEWIYWDQINDDGSYGSIRTETILRRGHKHTSHLTSPRPLTCIKDHLMSSSHVCVFLISRVVLYSQDLSILWASGSDVIWWWWWQRSGGGIYRAAAALMPAG